MLRLVSVITLVLPPVYAAQLQVQKPAPLAKVVSLQFVQPTPTKDYDKEVLVPLRAAQKAAEDARIAAEAAQLAREAAELARQQAVQRHLDQPAQAATSPVVSQTGAKAFIYAHESGNSPGSVNPSSGACGLGQALPCSKMPCSLSDYACQDSFFTSYMLNRYGTWENAQAFWLSHSWW